MATAGSSSAGEHGVVGNGEGYWENKSYAILSDIMGKEEFNKRLEEQFLVS